MTFLVDFYSKAMLGASAFQGPTSARLAARPPRPLRPLFPIFPLLGHIQLGGQPFLQVAAPVLSGGEAATTAPAQASPWQLQMSDESTEPRSKTMAKTQTAPRPRSPVCAGKPTPPNQGLTQCRGEQRELRAQLGCCRKTVLMVTATGKGDCKALGTGLDTRQQPLRTKDSLCNVLALNLK